MRDADPSEIPSREEHRRYVRRVWTLCVLFSLSILVGMGGTVAVLFIRDVDTQRIVAVSTIIFQVVIAMFATGFTTPLFLEQRANLNLGLEMTRRALEISATTAETVVGLKDEMKPVVADLRYIAEKGKPVSDALHKAVVVDRVLEKISADMEIIRRRVERDTEPLKVRRRDGAPVVLETPPPAEDPGLCLPAEADARGDSD